MTRGKKGKIEGLAAYCPAGTSANLGPVVAAIAYLAAAWIAAGSTGLLAHPLRRVLTLAALVVAILAQHPFPWRGMKGLVALLATVVLAIYIIASSLPVINVMGVSLVLASLAFTSPGQAKKMLRVCSVAVVVFGLYRMACTSIPRYDPEEIEAIERFVEQGGGLLLVGEHTNVFNTGTHINDIAKVFGFSFRYDCLFDIDTIYTQLYNLPLVPHPIIQSMPLFNFAVSCSIDPGRSPDRVVIRSTSLKNLLADYHASNFYPQVEDKTEMQYGAFVQLLTTRHAAGRVVAFTDSSVFSNFATFEPGKAELMLGMLEWLNHRAAPKERYSFVFSAVGIMLLAGGLALCRRPNVSWLIVVSAGVFGWAIAVMSTRAIHKYSMPLPKAVRPMVEVVVDRTVCDAPLSKSGFITGTRDGFGIFERWILRLGYFTSRKRGTDALSGELIVFPHPNRTVTSEFREDLVNYVASGGKVLIFDSPENTESTANSLLYPFGLNVNRSARINGQLKAPEGWPIIKIDSVFQIEAGEPIMSVVNATVAARVRHSKGTVTVIGFGSRLADAYMGVIGDVVPDDQLRKVFDLQFMILKDIISGL